MFYNDEMTGLDRQLFESAEVESEPEGDGGLSLMEALVRDGFFDSAVAVAE